MDLVVGRLEYMIVSAGRADPLLSQSAIKEVRKAESIFGGDVRCARGQE